MATAEGAPDQTTGPTRMAWFKRMLGIFDTGSVIDLGAGHGAFAQAAADLGWQVTASDVRDVRFPDDDRITWRVEDVREADVSGFDVISCLGLFYHLTLDDQLSLLKRSSGTPIILDTHVANDKPWPGKLTEPVVIGGYHGRLYPEPDQLTNPPASWGNDESFWPRPQALYRMLGEHGYSVMTANPWYLPTRTFFLCLPG